MGEVDINEEKALPNATAQTQSVAVAVEVAVEMAKTVKKAGVLASTTTRSSAVTIATILTSLEMATTTTATLTTAKGSRDQHRVGTMSRFLPREPRVTEKRTEIEETNEVDTTSNSSSSSSNSSHHNSSNMKVVVANSVMLAEDEICRAMQIRATDGTTMQGMDQGTRRAVSGARGAALLCPLPLFNSNNNSSRNSRRQRQIVAQWQQRGEDAMLGQAMAADRIHRKGQTAETGHASETAWTEQQQQQEEETE